MRNTIGRLADKNVQEIHVSNVEASDEPDIVLSALVGFPSKWLHSFGAVNKCLLFEKKNRQVLIKSRFENAKENVSKYYP